MEIFFDIAILVGKSIAESKQLLETYEKWQWAEFGGSCLDSNMCQFISGINGTMVIFNKEFTGEGEEFAKDVSFSEGLSIAYVQMYAEDIWLYRLFKNGEEVDKFNPMPDYWGRVSSAERKAWEGKLEVLDSFFQGIPRGEIIKYLCSWEDEYFNSPRKAYESDQFWYGIGWQVLDFIKKLGFSFPDDMGPSIIL